MTDERSAPTPDQCAPGARRPIVLHLARMELRLLGREPMAMIALLGFPIVMVLVIGGVFGRAPDPDFGGVAPDDYYVASYIGVVYAALGLITLPVQLATHRQTGVLRRYRAAGISLRTFTASQAVVGGALGVVGALIVLAVGAAVYGIGAPLHPLPLAAWLALGLACFVGVGVALGLLLPSARAATAVGNLLFVPVFLLGGGGPPRAVMPAPMRAVADAVPLSPIVAGVRNAWLGTTGEHPGPWLPLAVTAICCAVIAQRARRAAN